MLYRTSKLRNRPDVVIALVLIVVFGILVLGPLLQIIYTSITFQSYDLRVVREAREGQFTLYHYVRVFTGRLSRALFFKPFINSLMAGFGVTALTILIGALLAWAMVRTDIPWKRFFHGIMVIPYMMPSWVIALAWLIIFKNDRVAGEQGMLTYLTGITPPIWFSYGLFPIIICLGLHYHSCSYLLVSGALNTINSELEEAGSISGLKKGAVL